MDESPLLINVLGKYVLGKQGTENHKYIMQVGKPHAPVQLLLKWCSARKKNKIKWCSAEILMSVRDWNESLQIMKIEKW